MLQLVLSEYYVPLLQQLFEDAGAYFGLTLLSFFFFDSFLPFKIILHPSEFTLSGLTQN